MKAIYLVWGKTKFSGQLTACWNLPRKGGVPGLVPVPLASLIYRGEMPSATALRTGQISLEAQILAHSPSWETSLFLDREGEDGGRGPQRCCLTRVTLRNRESEKEAKILLRVLLREGGTAVDCRSRWKGSHVGASRNRGGGRARRPCGPPARNPRAEAGSQADDRSHRRIDQGHLCPGDHETGSQGSAWLGEAGLPRSCPAGDMRR